jgi:hypothetical protein
VAADLGDCGRIASFQLSALSFQLQMGAIPPCLTGGRRAGEENIVRKRWVIVWGFGRWRGGDGDLKELKARCGSGFPRIVLFLLEFPVRTVELG